MKTKFVDTNVFLRFLTDDNPSKAKKCYELFQSAERKELALTTSESVLAEVVYILSSKSLYNLDPSRIKQLLLPLVRVKGLKISAKKAITKALEIFSENNIDFEDALSIAHMHVAGIGEIYSYDRDFDRFGDIARLEP